MIHRDLKPDNVLVARDGRVVITDFGVAIAQGDRDQAPLPMLGAGTPLYMAPEQIEGRSIDERTDLYALGLILFEMLTGTLPWGTDGDTKASLARLSVPPSSPRQINNSIPESLASLVVSLLDREPSHRPREVDAVLHALESCKQELTAHMSTGPALSPIPPTPRSPAPASIAVTDTPHARAVAVLPIRNLGGPRDAYIADTLTEELTERLIVCPGVRVASRLALRLEEPGDLLEIGRRAGVDVMVEGSMFRQPSGLVRARLRMVEMEQGFVLWSESFERRASEIYELHADIAHAVARTLTVQLRRSRNVPQPENRESVDVFLRAKRAYAAGGIDSVHVALELLDEALRIGPSDPLLLSYKALALLRCWVLDTHGFSASVSEAHAIARRVLDTNPNQGEAHLALGIDAYLNANWVVAARRLEESVRCNPALSDAHYYLGLLRCSASHADTGLRMLDVAQRLDPKNLEAIWAYATTLALIGQVSRALDQLDRADFVHEDHPGTITARLRIATWQGDRQSVARAREAVSALRSLGFEPRRDHLALVHRRGTGPSGWRADRVCRFRRLTLCAAGTRDAGGRRAHGSIRIRRRGLECAASRGASFRRRLVVQQVSGIEPHDSDACVLDAAFASGAPSVAGVWFHKCPREDEFVGESNFDGARRKSFALGAEGNGAPAARTTEAPDPATAMINSVTAHTPSHPRRRPQTPTRMFVQQRPANRENLGCGCIDIRASGCGHSAADGHHSIRSPRCPRRSQPSSARNFRPANEQRTRIDRIQVRLRSNSADEMHGATGSEPRTRRRDKGATAVLRRGRAFSSQASFANRRGQIRGTHR